MCRQLNMPSAGKWLCGLLLLASLGEHCQLAANAGYTGGPFAIAAQHGINFNGNNIRIDSFDSTNPVYSSNGRYDPAKIKDGGNIISSSTNSVISVGNADIYGHVLTGYGGVASVGLNGSVGSLAWHYADNIGIEPGWFNEVAAIAYPDVSLPYYAGFDPSGGIVVLSNSVITTNSILTNSIYYPDNPPPSGVDTFYVTTNSVPVPTPPGLTTNLVTVTTGVLPYPLPSGTITTNLTTTTTTLYPVAGTYLGGVTTNTVVATTATYPSAGTYLGSVSTNIVTTTNAAYPLPGTYIGSVTTNHLGPKITYTYDAITGYIYAKIAGYTYLKITSYTFETIQYQYPVYSYTLSFDSTVTTYTTNYYDHILYSGDYYATSLTGMTIVLGSARLVLPNGFTLSSGDRFEISAGADVQIYAGGFSCAINTGATVNRSGLARSFILYCASSVTNLTCIGNGEFTGVVIATRARFSINGGGNDSTDLIGSFIVDSFSASGHLNIHADESLAPTLLLPPSISDLPARLAVLGGNDVTLSADVSGSGPFTYQWNRATFLPLYFPPAPYNMEAIPGATNSSFTITNAGPSDANYYMVTVGNSVDVVNSTATLLMVDYPLSISQQPADKLAVAGSQVTFSVSAVGRYRPWAHLLNYQWKFNGDDIPNGTNYSLTISNAQLSDAGSYSVVITNLAGPITSDLASLVIYAPAEISLIPSVDANSGSFQLDVNGDPGLDYVILGSTNLVDWISLMTNSSPFTYAETNAASIPQGFYRAVRIP